jgi:hypothetical protein
MKNGNVRSRANFSRSIIRLNRRGNANTLSVLGSEGELNPDAHSHVVRIRRQLKKTRYLQGKSVYKYHRYELTIPAEYKDLIERFMDKDLQVEAKQVGNNLIIEAKPIEKASASFWVL